MTKRKENADSEKSYSNRNSFLYRNKPVTDRELDGLAEDLLDEVEDPQMIKITSFLTDRRISTDTWYSWIKRHDRLRKAHNIALNVLGLRRERRALEGDYNPTIVLKTLGFYDEAYKAYFEEETKARDGVNTAPLKVVIERYGEVEE
jgi:hypothetical protein